MTTRDTAFAAGTPCWVDLMSSDPPKVRAFYSAVFGWDAEESNEEYGNYVTFTSDGRAVAGLMQNPPDSGYPDVWTTYIATDDIQAGAAAATDAGGQVMMGPMQVGEQGSVAVLLDTAGGAVGLWQAGQHTGFGKYNDTGSVAWHELHSKDFAKSKEFYASVFGWDYRVDSDTDEFRYVTAQVGGEAVAGIMDSAAFLPAEVPTHWTIYFDVADVDESVAVAEANGATVLVPAADTPFGRLAELLDPTGATFKLHSMKLADPGSVAESAAAEESGS